MFYFKKISLNDAEDIFKWRRASHVTQFMYTDLDDDFEGHIKWMKRAISSIKDEYFIIYNKDQKIGLISLNDIDKQNSKATSGFYIGDLKYAPLAGRIFPYFLNYVFYKKNLNKLVIEVMAHNINMKKMDVYYGFREVGTLENHILKNGIYYDVDILEITKKIWLTKEKFHKYVADFN